MMPILLGEAAAFRPDLRAMPDATPKVLSMSNEFKVTQVHAGTTHTSSRFNMVKFQSIWNWAYLTFIKPAVRSGRLAFRGLEGTITRGLCGTNPNHAAVGSTWIDMTPEENKGISGNEVTSRKLVGHRVASGVMRTDVSASRPLHSIP